MGGHDVKWRPFSGPPPLPECPATTGPDDLAEAKEARKKSTDDYLRTIDQNLEVRQVSERLKKRREANHFAELLKRAGWSPR